MTPDGNEDGRGIDLAEVQRIAALAQLSFEADELARMRDELSTILTYMRRLDEVDVEGVEPMEHAGVERMPWRADEAGVSLPHDEALAAAAKKTNEGFVVPTFVDEG